MSIIVTSRILVFSFVHHQSVEERHGLIQLIRLEIGIAHVELHLLRFIGGKREGVRLFIDGQSLLVLLFLEQMVGIQEIGVFRPSTARIIIHELDDLRWTVGLTQIERTDRLIILRVDTTLRFGISCLSAILVKNGERGTIFLVLEEQHTFIEKCFWVVVFNMFLC